MADNKYYDYYKRAYTAVLGGMVGERINPANVRPLALFMRFYIECQRVAQSSVRCIKLYPFDVGGLRCIRLPGGRL